MAADSSLRHNLLMMLSNLQHQQVLELKEDKRHLKYTLLPSLGSSVIKEGETLANAKIRIQKKLQVPDDEFSKKKDLGREVDEFEVFERIHKKKQGTGEFVDNKSTRVSEQYRERLNVDDHITPSFDLKSWCDVVGGQYKGRVYGFGCNQHFERSYNGSSNEMCSNEKNNELSQEIEDMRATSKRMEKEIIESKNKLELVITENRQRENKLIEESRQREEKLRKLDKEKKISRRWFVR